MRMIPAALAVAIVVVSSPRALPQAGVHYDDAEHSVRNMLAHPGGYFGSDVKSLSRLGDASAVALTKVLGGNGVSPEQMNQVLLIVTLSFEGPKSIENPADRQPRTTLFLLKYLECSTSDPEVRTKIAETRALLQSKLQPGKE
jgi:hypothetical protein